MILSVPQVTLNSVFVLDICIGGLAEYYLSVGRLFT